MIGRNLRHLGRNPRLHRSDLVVTIFTPPFGLAASSGTPDGGGISPRPDDLRPDSLRRPPPESARRTGRTLFGPGSFRPVGPSGRLHPSRPGPGAGRSGGGGVSGGRPTGLSRRSWNRNGALRPRFDRRKVLRISGRLVLRNAVCAGSWIHRQTMVSGRLSTGWLCCRRR